MSAPMLTSPLYAVPPRQRRPLRVLVVAPERIPAWLWSFVCMAADAAWLDVTVLPVADGRLPRMRDIPLSVRAFLGVERMYRRRASPTLSYVAMRPRDGVGMASSIALDAPPQQLAARMRELQPDLVLSLGPAAWSHLIADAAKLGCWDIDAGLVDPSAAGVALMLPIVRRESATEMTLELEGAPLAPWGHATSVGATRAGSFALQRDSAFLKLPLLLLRMLHRLAADDFMPPHRTARLRDANRAMPGIADVARTLAITLGTALKWQWLKNKPKVPWLLFFRHGPAPLDPSVPHVRDTAMLQAPPGFYWADPCAVETQGHRFVFVEEVDHTHKGVIACLELHGAHASPLGRVLEEGTHVSYPQVFEWDGVWYMTVECSQAKRVSLYRAARFPFVWERTGDLIRDRVCSDPTLYFHNGHWYLFTTVSENRNGTWDELFLFVSDELGGPFQPHPANPVVSDVRRARSAGRLFTHGGALIRPAQDCASHYGSAVVFNEVLVLSPTHYEERPLSRLAPDWAPGLLACHTYSVTPTIEVLDARGNVPADTPRIDLVPAADGFHAATAPDPDHPRVFPPAGDPDRGRGRPPRTH